MIDAGIGQPWPEPVLAAVNRFKQGDIIERPPIFYAAVTAYAISDRTKLLGQPSSEPDLVNLDPTDVPPYGLITTQTCDLAEESLKPKQPWFHVVPVYDAEPMAPRDQQGLIKNHR